MYCMLLLKVLWRVVLYFFATKSQCTGCMYDWPKASSFCSKLCDLRHPNLLQDNLDFIWLVKCTTYLLDPFISNDFFAKQVACS